MKEYKIDEETREMVDGLQALAKEKGYSLVMFLGNISPKALEDPNSPSVEGISVTVGAAGSVVFATQKLLENTIGLIRKYCGKSETASAVLKIFYETFEKMLSSTDDQDDDGPEHYDA